MNKRYLKPGKSNQEDRFKFIEYWVEHMKQYTDKEWSEQQIVLLDSQYLTSRSLIHELAKTKDGQRKLKEMYNITNVNGCAFLDKLQE